VTGTISALLVNGELPSASDVTYEKAYSFYCLDNILFDDIPVTATLADGFELEEKLLEDTTSESPTPSGMLDYNGSTYPSSLDYLDSSGAVVSENIPPPTPKMPPDSLTLVLAPTSTPYTLSVTTSGNGTFNQFPTGNSFPADTVVALTAVPSATSTLADWGGACSGTGACIVTMSANQSVSATFTGVTTDAVTPLNLNLGSAGGCAGGTLSGTINVTAVPGVSWTAIWDGVPDAYINVYPSPASGSGSGVVAFTIVVGLQYGTCSDTTSVPNNQEIVFSFSDGSQLITSLHFTYILVN
jgi:hypothetical protein